MKKIFRIAISLLMIVGFLAIFGVPRKAEAIFFTQIAVSPNNALINAISTYTISFNNPIVTPANAKILIQFPTGFNLSGSQFVSWTGFDGGQTLVLSGQTITIVRDNIGTSASAGFKTLVISNIINSAAPTNNYQATLIIQDANNNILAGPTGSIYFQIVSAGTETSIDGLYYFREPSPTHYQNNGNYKGAGYDIGALTKTIPTQDEYRFCGVWVQYYFDENGIYTQNKNINNIYYHIWWYTYNTGGLIGYDELGGYNAPMSNSINVTPENAQDKINNYYLNTGKQTVNKSVTGTSIYNFSVKFDSPPPYTGFPRVLSSPSQPSFVIFNLPDDAILKGRDSDGDGLNDFDELFIYNTNPYDRDTDKDTSINPNYTDGYEINHQLNPNDPNHAPLFDKPLMKEFASTIWDENRSALAALPDITGDGKDEIIIGSPKGTGNGSVFIYSADGNLIKQIDGTTGLGGFGAEVSAIGDQDSPADGKSDIVITSNTDIYIYSSQGPLLRKIAKPENSFGGSLAIINDQDNSPDNKDDLLISAPGANNSAGIQSGKVYLYSSSGIILKEFAGDQQNQNFGISVSSLGDQNGDGKQEIAIGAQRTNSNNGAVYIYSSLGELLKTFNGKSSEALGSKVDKISDLNNDGKDEIIIGAPLADPGGKTNVGAVYIFSLSDTTTPVAEFDGDAPGVDFGSMFTAIGDQDFDRKPDIIITSKFASPGNKEKAGAAVSYSTSTRQVLKTYEGIFEFDSFGNTVASIKDEDSDGLDDVLISAPYTEHVGAYNSGSIYLYPGSNNIAKKNWNKNSSLNNAFNLDNYFRKLSSGEIINYSVTGNTNITVTIDPATHFVSFSQPADWLGQESVIFQATNQNGLKVDSNNVTLTVDDPPTITKNCPLQATRGQTVECAIIVSNPSTGKDITNLIVSEKLEPSLQFISTDNGGTFDPQTRIMRWLFPRLNKGSIINIKLKATIIL